MDITPKPTTYDFCSLCDKDLYDVPYDEKRPTRFCCDEHRITFHNERRKIGRASKRASDAITELHNIFVSSGGTEIPNKSLKELLYLKRFLSNYLQGVRWYCTECGQTTYEEPVLGHKCGFCQCVDSYRVRT